MYKPLPRERRVITAARRAVKRKTKQQRAAKAPRSHSDIVVDIAKSEARCAVGSSMVACLVPNSKSFRPHTGQLLHPKGQLALQGIWSQDFSSLRGIDGGPRQLANWAGNAMSTTVLVAVFVAAGAHFPELMSANEEGLGAEKRKKAGEGEEKS